MAYNQYDLANTSLVKMGGLTEMYIPLWVYSSANNGTASFTTGGMTNLIAKGATAPQNNTSATKLHTLNSNWSPSQKFSFETSIYINSASGTASCALWDITSNTVVSGSQVSTTSTTFTILRSSQFILTPRHVYGVTIYASSGYSVYLTKASLVAFIGG